MAHRRGAILLAVLLCILLGGWWGISAVSISTAAKETNKNEQVASVMPSDATIAMTGPVLLHHSVQNGLQTYSGAIVIASNCETISTALAPQNGNPPHLKLAIAVSKPDPSCRSVATTTDPFSVSFSSRTNSPLVFDGVMINGNDVPASIIEN